MLIFDRGYHQQNHGPSWSQSKKTKSYNVLTDKKGLKTMILETIGQKTIDFESLLKPNFLSIEYSFKLDKPWFMES